MFYMFSVYGARIYVVCSIFLAVECYLFLEAG